MSAHTPGPWRYEGPDPFGDYNILPPDDHTGALGAVVSNERPAAEVAANARLIAAAPELLDLAQFVAENPNAARGMGDVSHALWEQMQGKAHAALAKVRGEV